MIKQLMLENWKSFRYAVLNIDPLTVLIGTNASGKSNAIEALEFLYRTALGETFQDALMGNVDMPALRGGSEWATLHGQTQFALSVVIQGETEAIEYFYTLRLQTQPTIQLISESLIERETRSETPDLKEKLLFSASSDPQTVPDSSSSHQQDDTPGPYFIFLDHSSTRSCLAVLTFLGQGIPGIDSSAHQGINQVFKALKGIFVLDPVPSQMRGYSALSTDLFGNASNLAGVLALLSKAKKSEVESILLKYAAHLPEQDIQRIWAETVGRLKTDAMLYCEETWFKNQPPMLMDARGMSDGTLRFLAVLTALLTRPEGSQLVIEEVDNGLHPSRADLLLKMLVEIGTQRRIDVLVTTHNPALLNALDPDYIPFVTVVHRDIKTGESKLTLLEDLENLPKLLASGSLGKLSTQGAIERSLEDYVPSQT